MWKSKILIPSIVHSTVTVKITLRCNWVQNRFLRYFWMPFFRNFLKNFDWKWREKWNNWLILKCFLIGWHFIQRWYIYRPPSYSKKSQTYRFQHNPFVKCQKYCSRICSRTLDMSHIIWRNHRWRHHDLNFLELENFCIWTLLWWLRKIMRTKIFALRLFFNQVWEKSKF